MTRDEMFDRILARSKACRGQKTKTRRMLRACLATWPGQDAMVLEASREGWQVAAVQAYQKTHPAKLKGEYGIPIALLMILAEIIIRLLWEWWQNRQLTNAEMMAMHLQA